MKKPVISLATCRFFANWWPEAETKDDKVQGYPFNVLLIEKRRNTSPVDNVWGKIGA
jgi:hypothetical protein